MENRSINYDIINLWKKNFNDNYQALGPIFYGKFNKECVLFIGCNPSFSERGFKKILKDTEYEKIDPKDFFKWKKILDNLEYNVNECILIEKIAVKRHDFFKPLKDIAGLLGLPFQHVDLFLYKQTSQAEFKKRIFKNGNINKFGLDQIAIFRKIISESQPKIIVVANALVAKIIREQFMSSISEFDEKNGFHWFSLSKNKKIPIFFSSMITGQRALDIYSRERLVWHIQQALKVSKNN